VIAIPRSHDSEPTRGTAFEDTFEGTELDRTRWLPYYLPQWSSRERAAARFRVGGGALRLLIEDDQEPWCPEFDDGVRVSSLQTGVLSGPVGSPVGQHRFAEGLVVREAQEATRLFTPLYGRIEMRAAACRHPDTMVALWLIGYEETPDQSAEICVCEIFGRDIGDGESIVGVGVHPFGDPGIVDDFSRVTLPIDAAEPHVYTAEWRPDGIDFLVDGEQVKRVRQSPAYPMQLMLGIYGFPSGPPPLPERREFVVDWVRVSVPPA
jgi:hypothetical protein